MMVGSRHLGRAWIITTKCMALRDGIQATRFNGFSNKEIEGGSRVIIYCFNKTSSLPSYIIQLMEDI